MAKNDNKKVENNNALIEKRDGIMAFQLKAEEAMISVQKDGQVVIQTPSSVALVVIDPNPKLQQKLNEIGDKMMKDGVITNGEKQCIRDLAQQLWNTANLDTTPKSCGR